MRNFFVLLALLYAGSAFAAYPVIVKNTDSGAWPGDTKVTSATMTVEGILSTRGAAFLTPPTVNGKDVLTTVTRVASSEESDVCTTATFAVIAATAQGATWAATATSATLADLATTATWANTATSSTYATHANSADTATTATRATSSTYATNAGSAAHAASADTATTATVAIGYGKLTATTQTWSGLNDFVTPPTVRGVALGTGSGSTTCYTSSGTLASGAVFNVTHASDPYPNYKRTAQMFTRTRQDSLLLHLDINYGGSTFVEETGKTVTISGVTFFTVQSKFGGRSGLFSSPSYLSVAGTTEVSNFGTGDFTIDFWVYPTAVNPTNSFVYQGSGSPNLAFLYSSGSLALLANGGQTIASGSCSLTANNWYHIAASRSGTSVKLFLNGNAVATALSSASIGDATNALKIGDFGASYGVVGYIDEVRVTKGFARWTANFTPPTASTDPSYTCMPFVNTSASSYVSIAYLNDTTTQFINATGSAFDCLALVQILP